MARVKQKTHTRDLILDAAETLFAAQGYQATTINQLAEQVGIQGPAIYKHFSSKRSLFEDVLERLFTPFSELMDREQEEIDRQQSIVNQHLANPNASRILQHATLSGGEDLGLLVERWYLSFFGQVREMLEASDSGITPVSVMASHSMLLGYLTLAPLHQAIFDIDPLSQDALDELMKLQMTFASAASGS